MYFENMSKINAFFCEKRKKIQFFKKKSSILLKNFQKGHNFI